MVGWLVAGIVAVIAAWRLQRWRWWSERVRRYVEDAAANPPAGETPAGPSADAALRLEESVARVTGELWAQIRATDEESRQLRAMIGAMVEGVLVVDAEGVVLLTNPRVEELLQIVPRGPHVGRSFAELCRHPDLHHLLRVVMSEAGWDRSLVQEVTVGAGRDVTLQVTASPLSRDGGLEKAYVLVFHDISAMRQLERVRRDFVANVSHELRTPLAAICGYTETLLSGALEEPERARRFLGIIERHGDRLGRLVDDLLILSDLELGRMELQLGALDVPCLVEATFETLRGKAAQSGVSLEWAPFDGPPVDADADRLEQALLNLVDNAIKYTPSGGQVRVSSSLAAPSAAPSGVPVAEDVSSFVEIAVSDTGVGVPPDDLSRLTERFYRVDKARSRELGGTGLGLAIVKHIVQAHGGWMTIESELHEGTTVRLFLPAHRAAQESLAERVARE